MKTARFFGFGLALTSACATLPDGRPGEVLWQPVVCHEGSASLERIRCGRPDPGDPNLQAMGVDQAGDVTLVHFSSGVPRSETIYRHGSELTALLPSDLDGSIPGEELYVGGYARGDGREGVGGAVVQLALGGAAPRVRRVWEGSAYVHSIERIEPQRAGDVAQLLVTTYDGELHALEPVAGTGPWKDTLLFRSAPELDPETLKIKDAAFLIDPSGRAPHELVVVFKLGRVLFLDLDRPQDARVVHEETGGLSRVTRDALGGAYITGYFGRVLRVNRSGDGLAFEVIDQEGTDSGLRGLALGRFPVDATTTADKVIWGFHRRCRALVERQGVLDPVTLFVDIERGHALDAADLVPGNDADEILVGGYSKRITMLVARRR